jgi:hypothetical protein
MAATVPDADFEPEWLWATRITAQAARAAMGEGRTPQERFAIYERLILAGCEERHRRTSPERGGAIAEAAASILGNPLYNDIEVDTGVDMSAFEQADP